MYQVNFKPLANHSTLLLCIKHKFRIINCSVYVATIMLLHGIAKIDKQHLLKEC
jgi:hypothetical protein